MRRRAVFTAMVVALAACGAHVQQVILPPLSGDEGAVRVYLDAFPSAAARLMLDVESAALERADGTTAPLELALSHLSAADVKYQRLLASGRVPAGAYSGLLVKVKRARLDGEGGRSDLLVGPEASRVHLQFQLDGRRVALLSLALQYERSTQGGFAFAAQFTSTRAGPALTQFAGASTDSALASLLLFDRQTRRVIGVLATGGEPRGVALDAAARRGYVALAAEDEVQVLDLVNGDDLVRLRLRPGDRPREVQLVSGERTVLTVNQGSGTAAFLAATTGVELARVRVGEDPIALLVDRAEQRAYVFNRRTSTISVLDVPHHTLVQTVATDAEPLRGSFNRVGNRLYVVFAGSSYMSVFSVPDMALLTRIYVGLGASAVKVDPRTDLIYVASRLDSRVAVFDALSPMPIEYVDLAGGSSYLTVDEAENALVAVMPERHAIAYVDLSSGDVVATVDVGRDPYVVALVGERR
jgi:DNA-binding beta-propeller fold protein YncE